MCYFAICKLTNGEYECIYVKESSLVYELPFTGHLDWEATIDKTIEQLAEENEVRQEQDKITWFIYFIEYGNEFEEVFESAKRAWWPHYDFREPELGVFY